MSILDAATTLDTLLGLGKEAIERIWPDPMKRAEELRKLEELRQKGDLAQLDARVKLLLAQLKVNAQEAKHASLFVAGWRPGIGWVGVFALASIYIPKAVVQTILWTYQAWVTIQAFDPTTSAIFPELPPFPDLGVTDLIGLLGSMLGIGILRTAEKTKGVDTKVIQ